ncbi:DUF3108 domain-containing protein [Palleronia caenipelagi]|uniref:DUF3108 domain-containing protein n=1 Tax=Palleronia caenipelagi TaxID=2489174 RepID=A0A547Q724_9RHOB|nr:DUF3108 domain-containing protein [Palleronia caenipelagi]TRD22187.1 DUF3108 domain-containing protein [Palleronia caenipelagi]
MKSLILAAGLATSAMPAVAETYDIRLAGSTVGSLTATPTALTSQLNNTPMGAADGWFKATSDGTTYAAENSGGRKIRTVIEGGRVTSTTVTPNSEATDLSEPSAVPAGVLDPVRGFAQVMRAGDCPDAFRMYDGRRAIEVTPKSRSREGNLLICQMDYRVIAGPGHVSPFRLKNLTMETRYTIDGDRVTGMALMRLKAGPFTVTLAAR